VTGQSSRICLSLTASTLEEDLRLLESRRTFVDMAEMRADFLDPAELSDLPSFPKRSGLPVILAIRRQRDGGAWNGGEARRRTLLAGALRGGYAYADLEEDLEDPDLPEAAKRAGTRVIRSGYDLSGVPEGLADRLRSLARLPGEIPKLEVTPRSTRDLPALAEAFRRLEGVEKILTGAGEFGLFSRLLASKLGSFLTCCFLPGGERAAAGQLDPRSLVELYRFRKQDRETFVCGVIGNPIAHSRSPELHNLGYEALGLNGVYVPFLVDDVPSFFELAEILDLRGFSVTMPHKRAVLPHLAERDESLERIGACNTVVRRREGWFGANTDLEGFLAPLQARAPELLSPETRATVIGAGGAARSVLYALHSRGISPLVLNRTPERARALAEAYGCDWAGLDAAGVERMRDNGDLIVQATGVGMDPQSDADPLPEYRFSGSEVVYDLVYQPLMTVFLQRAQAAGCRIVSGLAMLYSQGAAQFKRYTGREFPWEALDSNDLIVK
jgi:3-dehydroquinate dehydratase / shikimate dehydrogenase